MERLTMSVKEAAARLGVNPQTIRLAIRRGEFPAISIGKRQLVPVAQLDEFLRQKNQEKEEVVSDA